MASYSEKFYEGANYSLNPKYSLDLDKKYGSSQSLSPYVGFNLPMSSLSITTDPRTANQIDAVSKKISTGTKAIEITGIDTNVLEYMPKQHMKELERLKKIAGVELTFHGPLVEPTGVGRGNWDPQQREFAERQMWSALERARDLGKNTVVTFHSSNGLPETETWIMEKDKDGKQVEKLVNIAVVDERTGRFGVLPKTGKNYWDNKEDYKPQDDLEFINKQNWAQRLSNINIEAQRARSAVVDSFERTERQIKKIAEDETQEGAFKQAALEAYKYARDDPKKYEDYLSGYDPAHQAVLKDLVTNLSYGNSFATDAYINLKESFNQAYEAAKRDKESINADARKKAEVSLAKLNDFQKEIVPLVEQVKGEPRKLDEFTQSISKGLLLLENVAPPRTLRPLREFALEQASETFSNLAVKAYQQFEKKDQGAPIISIENPPVGMGLSRGQDLKELVDSTQKKVIEQLQKKEGLSHREAEEAARKLVGVTWDVGHINMLKKYGHTDKDILRETEKVKEHVKHIHLSDNFGLEHTELPMGMGNVPIAEHEKILKEQFGEQFKKIKQVVETGGWFQHFKYTPLAETFEAFGSPLYGMKMPSYWNVSRGTGAGYFGGYGRMLPDVNFSTYGSGFSNLPPELGGQMAGRSRLSGNPTE